MHDTQKLETYSQDFTDALFQVFTRERNNRNITLDDVYSKLEIHQATYYRWKNRQTPLSKSIIENLASVLDISGHELKALTKCQMDLNEKGIIHPNTALNLEISKISTSVNQLDEGVARLETSFFRFFQGSAKSLLLKEFDELGNETINNYSFPYYCLEKITDNVNKNDKDANVNKDDKGDVFFEFTLALNWAFSEFSDDIDMKKDIEKLITKPLKAATIPSRFKKWTTLNILVQLRNYYIYYEPVEYKADSLDPTSIKSKVNSSNYKSVECVIKPFKHKLYKCNNAIVDELPSTSKKEIKYELLLLAFYFSQFSEKDLEIIFNCLFGFLLLSKTKQEKLTSELFSFCSDKIG